MEIKKKKGAQPGNKNGCGNKGNKSLAYLGRTPWNKGKKHSPETVEKLRVARLGKKWSEETRVRMAETKKNKGATRWIFDRSKLKRQEERDGALYKEWRLSVWKRDGFKCRIGNGECSGRIEAHHILSWRDHPELRYENRNGITLCKFHHPRKREEEARLSPYFQQLISEIV